jgi:hypothetical protein
MRRNLLLFVLAALPAVGCKKASFEYAAARAPDAGFDVATVAAAPPASTPADAIDEEAVLAGSVGAEDVTVEQADDAPMMSKRSFGSYRRGEREARRRKDAPARGPAKPAEGAPSGGEAGKAEPADDKPPVDAADRHIIYTATMQVSVFNLVDATKKAEELPDKHGGYIQSMTEGQIVLKIPAARLRAVMSELAGFGVVEHRTLAAQDVTDEFLDIETRIRVLQETQAQLIALLGKARTVDEALHVRQTLDGITMELEVLKGRLRQLENLVAYSTLTLTLVERGPFTPTPTTNDPFPWVNELGVEATEWK